MSRKKYQNFLIKNFINFIIYHIKKNIQKKYSKKIFKKNIQKKIFKKKYSKKKMVIFVKSSNPEYTIYLGKDKYENEDLIKYGFPIDIWFHVENYSSAHVYLRLPDNITCDKIPKEILEECCQIVKDSSKDGRKQEKVNICYTPWENLKKTNNMEIGEVSFKDMNKVYYIRNISKNSELLKKLKKNSFEKNIDYAAEKESYNLEVKNKMKKELEEKKRKEKEEIKKAKELKKEQHFEYIDQIGTVTTNKDEVDLEDDFW